MLRIGRYCRGGGVTDFVLLAIFLTLVFVFLTRKGYMSRVDNAIKVDHGLGRGELANPALQGLDNVGVGGDSDMIHAVGAGNVDREAESRKLIDTRIRNMPDVRDHDCKHQTYMSQKPVSIVIEFFDYQFYDLKTTVGSILHNTKKDLVAEIIAVDDGSTLDYIMKDSSKYCKQRQIKLIRLEKRLGTPGARMEGAKAATSDIIVFADTNVLCNQGWLPPLIDLLGRDSKVLAVPHYDSISDPVSYEYEKSPDDLVGSFTWSLATRMVKKRQSVKATKPVDTAVLRGNIFAVHKKYFEELGAYDTGFEENGGEHLELSLRTWMCGGTIRIAPCSRVGVLNLYDPLKIVNHRSVRRITELWMKDHKTNVMKAVRNVGEPTGPETESTNKRKSELQHKLSCQNFKWYLSNVAKDLFTPSPQTVHYGLLKCQTGRCAYVQVGDGKDRRLDLGDCTPERNGQSQTQMTFEYTKDNTMVNQGKCLMVQSSAYLTLEDCKSTEKKQKFLYKPTGELVNEWSQYCAMHVTDPDKKRKGRQIAMAQDCSMDKTGDFMRWKFIPV